MRRRARRRRRPRDERQPVRAVDGGDRVELHGLEPADGGGDVVGARAAEARREPLVRDDVAPQRRDAYTHGRAGGPWHAGRAVRAPLRLVLVLVGRRGSSRRVALFVVHHDDPPMRADAVVVLQGSKTRLPLGYRLMQQGYAPLLLVSRGSGLPLEHRLCDGETPLEVVCFSSTSTRGEARIVARIARERKLRSLDVVTSQFHVYRARKVFERCYDGELHMVGAPQTWWRFPKLHRHRDGQARLPDARRSRLLRRALQPRLLRASMLRRQRRPWARYSSRSDRVTTPTGLPSRATRRRSYRPVSAATISSTDAAASTVGERRLHRRRDVLVQRVGVLEHAVEQVAVLQRADHVRQRGELAVAHDRELRDRVALHRVDRLAHLLVGRDRDERGHVALLDPLRSARARTRRARVRRARGSRARASTCRRGTSRGTSGRESGSIASTFASGPSRASDLQRRPHRRPRRAAGEQTLLAREPPRDLERVAVADAHPLVDDLRVHRRPATCPCRCPRRSTGAGRRRPSPCRRSPRGRRRR